jgi:hypothetical protein
MNAPVAKLRALDANDVQLRGFAIIASWNCLSIERSVESNGACLQPTRKVSRWLSVKLIDYRV